MAPKIHRFTVQISEFAARKLICWARIHGKAKATYAGQIIDSRIEGNFEIINRQMQDIASFEGITVEELERRWLEEEGFLTSSEVIDVPSDEA